MVWPLGVADEREERTTRERIEGLRGYSRFVTLTKAWGATSTAAARACLELSALHCGLVLPSALSQVLGPGSQEAVQSFERVHAGALPAIDADQTV